MIEFFKNFTSMMCKLTCYENKAAFIKCKEKFHQNHYKTDVVICLQNHRNKRNKFKQFKDMSIE